MSTRRLHPPRVRRSSRLRSCVSLLVVLATLTACTARRLCEDGCTVETDSATGTDSIELQSGFVPLMQSFDLSFVGNDRPLSSLAVGAQQAPPGSTPQFHLEMQDGDGGDAIDASARYFTWAEGSRAFFGLPEASRYGVQRFVPRTRCRGECDITLPDYDLREDMLVFTGFRFGFPDGEHNIRAIGIDPFKTESASSVRVAFRDDDGTEEFDVEFSYVLFPRHWTRLAVNATWFLNAPLPHGPTYRVPINDGWAGRIALLGGFWFEYANGDEHIKAIGVNVDTEATPHPVVDITFHDNDSAEEFKPDAIYWGFCRADGADNVHVTDCSPEE